jgi:hypothetical protein
MVACEALNVMVNLVVQIFQHFSTGGFLLFPWENGKGGDTSNLPSTPSTHSPNKQKVFIKKTDSDLSVFFEAACIIYKPASVNTSCLCVFPRISVLVSSWCGSHKNFKDLSKIKLKGEIKQF